MKIVKEITYGRSYQNDVPFPNDPKISRFHCRITQYDNGTFEILDTGSTNGTYVNNRDIPIGKPYSLQRTDIVRIGGTTLTWMKDFSSYSSSTDIPATNIPDNHHDPDDESGKTGNVSLVVFFCGLFSIGIVIYIVVEYFGNSLLGVAGAAFGGTVGFLKLFPWYLHGVLGIGGQWLPMFASFVIGGAADLIDNFNKKEDGLSRTGVWLANIGVSMALLFIVLAILAPLMFAL